MGFTPEEERRINRWLWVIIIFAAVSLVLSLAGCVYIISLICRWVA